MKLIIDIGNTNSKLALFKRKKLVKEFIGKNLIFEKVQEFTKSFMIRSSIISSVVEFNNEHQNIIQHYDSIILSSETPLPIKLIYENPETLGTDRIAVLVASVLEFPNQDILVFDIGTCLTFDYITAEATHLGGRISPGIQMRFDALHYFTDKLPRIVNSEDMPKIGIDTKSSIISGVQQGLIAEIESIITYYKKENPKINVMITGGDSIFLQRELKSSIFVDPFLLFKGLNEILDYNNYV